MKYTLIFLISLTLVFSSCDKETPVAKCKEVTESQQAFLDYWYFPEGSWWVYQLKSSPGVFDTVTVVNTRKDYLEPCKKDCTPGFFTCKMIYEITLRHSNKNYFKAGDIHDPAEEVLIAQSNALKTLINLRDNLLPKETIFTYPVTLGTSYGNIILADTNNVVTPLGIFKNSAHLKTIITSQADTIGSTKFILNLFFTKDIGFTKRVYTGNQTWQLVNYHINR